MKKIWDKTRVRRRLKSRVCPDDLAARTPEAESDEIRQKASARRCHSLRAASVLLLACVAAMPAFTGATAAWEFAEHVVSEAKGDGPLHFADTKKLSDQGSDTDPTAEPVGDKLKAIHVNGLPIPTPYIDRVATNAKFRIEAHSTVSASVATVIAFYRSELRKMSWMEDASLARIEPNSSVLTFHAPEGVAELTVTKVRQGTGSDLILRKTAAAEKSGLLPAMGMATVVIGNPLEEPAAVTINGTTFKIGPGEGVGELTGPKLALPPGTYKTLTAIGSNPATEDNFAVHEGEIWGLLLGQSTLALQMY